MSNLPNSYLFNQNGIYKIVLNLEDITGTTSATTDDNEKHQTNPRSNSDVSDSENKRKNSLKTSNKK
jgi:hypothetical protein